MSAVEIFNLIASIFGIVTGIVALLLSVIFYLSARNSEKNNDQLLVEIKTSTALLTKLSMKHLDRLTTAIVAPRPTEEKLVDAIKDLTSNSATVNNTEEVGKPTKAQLEQWRVDNLFTSIYYAATTNLTTQALIALTPNTPEYTETFQTYKSGLDVSAKDYRSIMSLIYSADDYEKKINSSVIKHIYEQAKAIETQIKNSDEYYTGSSD
jgi:hypothetical protein